MGEEIKGVIIVDAFKRVSQTLIDESDYLTSLDQAIGDGDMGINMERIGRALMEYSNTTVISDIGNYLINAGMITNKVAPSTMGTLIAIALLRAGKEVKGKSELLMLDLSTILKSTFDAIQERGKANIGDKTILDALLPAYKAFDKAVNAGKNLQESGLLALRAAEEGRDKVTPLKSKIGRASWVGDRSVGNIDPGCALIVAIFSSLLNT